MNQTSKITFWKMAVAFSAIPTFGFLYELYPSAKSIFDGSAELAILVLLPIVLVGLAYMFILTGLLLNKKSAAWILLWLNVAVSFFSAAWDLIDFFTAKPPAVPSIGSLSLSWLYFVLWLGAAVSFHKFLRMQQVQSRT